MQSRNASLGFVLLAVAGCASPTAGLGKVAPRTPPTPPEAVARRVAVRVAPVTAGITGTGEFSLGRGAGAPVVLIAEAAEPRDVERELLAEVDREAARLRRNLEAEISADFDAVFEEIHERFMAQAPAVGEDWARLAFLVGFPDPGEPVTLPPERTMRALELAQARLARAQISQASEKFRSEVLALLEAARERRRTLQTNLEVQIAIMRDEAEQRARAEAHARRADYLEVASDLGRLDVTIPASVPRELTVPGLSETGPNWPQAPRQGWRFAEREDRLARLYLALEGRKPDRRRGQDLTKEYREWLGLTPAGR